MTERDDEKRESSGWEDLTEEASGGTLRPSEELEQALREAAEALEGREAPAARAAGSEPERRGEDPAAASPAEPRGGEEGSGETPSVQELQAELARTQDRLLRLAADFENFRRRALKDREEAHTYGHQNLVKDLLPTVDNLERAIEAVQSGGGDLESLLQGVELVLRELRSVLSKHGVSEIEADRQPFDPSVHEAMAQAPDASVPPNTVVQVFQRGYRLRDRLLRPARVVVSTVPETEAPGATKNED